jgi:hypothetical protein
MTVLSGKLLNSRKLKVWIYLINTVKLQLASMTSREGFRQALGLANTTIVPYCPYSIGGVGQAQGLSETLPGSHTGQLQLYGVNQINSDF